MAPVELCQSPRVTDYASFCGAIEIKRSGNGYASLAEGFLRHFERGERHGGECRRSSGFIIRNGLGEVGQRPLRTPLIFRGSVTSDAVRGSQKHVGFSAWSVGPHMGSISGAGGICLGSLI